MCVCAPAYMSICMPGAHQKPEEDISSPRTGVTNGCEMPYEY